MKTHTIRAVTVVTAFLASTPAAAVDFTISDPTPQLLMMDTDIGERDWELGLDIFCNGCVDFFSSGIGSPFVIEPGMNAMTGLLYLDGLARVGVNTTVPAFTLHVQGRNGNDAVLLVQNPLAPPPGDVSMFRLINAGANVVRFVIGAQGGASLWTFDNNPNLNSGAGVNSGEFRIAKVGTGVPEFTVDGFGNGTFFGNSFAVNHVNTSSREAKLDFAPVDEREVLDKLVRLPITTWRYRSKADASLHMGPVAEDFQQAFGLSDGRHISTVDASGVALAAIQGLYEIVQEKDTEIAALMEDRQALAERLERLERLFSELSVTAGR